MCYVRFCQLTESLSSGSVMGADVAAGADAGMVKLGAHEERFNQHGGHRGHRVSGRNAENSVSEIPKARDQNERKPSGTEPVRKRRNLFALSRTFPHT